MIKSWRERRGRDRLSIVGQLLLAGQLLIGAAVVHMHAQRDRTQDVINQAQQDRMESLADRQSRTDAILDDLGARFRKVEVGIGVMEEARRLEYGIIVAVAGQLILSTLSLLRQPTQRH